MRRLILAMAIVAGVGMFSPLVTPAVACPMCKEANEADAAANRPKAYMYSILFMLAMPATLLTGFGVGFYRLSRQQEALLEQDQAMLDAEQSADRSQDAG